MPKKNLDFPDLSNWGIDIQALKGLSLPWQKFYSRLPNISAEVIDWKDEQLLSYFMKKFYEKCGFAYALSFQGPPCKCQEIMLLKKLQAMLSSVNPILIKEYIDWVIENKVNDKFIVKKIGFLLISGFQNEFLAQRKKKLKVTRSSTLPELYLKLAKESDIQIETYGDLIMLLQMIKNNPENLDQCYIDFEKKLKMYCFDFDSLKGI